ncbi:hypothetical protein GPY51_06055 [Photorhabdus laumondii subsp. laumondii]|uniref:Uncharacterized protein n=1 Tax=Photorhabdus laumondii subsp. laumondii TaxID=141679 RepID=A0A6L9JHW2_PHOLM|nr:MULTISPECIES: hypothetical protein [Photorhabdus]AXG42256.1 hypothetical protein PluDJC_08310 [Photorhabdus laumondii subsp. laumondii]MCC8384075.1 hypothetical protein [Photorhabdus laumondii]MCC8390613.1 hypothetical protein [Photorhabdus laumondii]MCC8412881.1 hypothetical protein [Photorhabdus laumondii]MCZ1248438.1 hypothetical protein [Photorhabdus laumondii subsp. laumondii]
MKKTILIPLLILVGCSSIQDMRNREPNQVSVSTKQAKNVAECILFGWQENSPRYGGVFIQPYGNGYTVYSNSQLEVADVINDNNIVKVNFYHQSGLFSYRINTRIEKIENCI